MSISSTTLCQLKLPVSIVQVGPEGGAFFSDPLTQTLQTVTAPGTGSNQSSLFDSQLLSFNTQNVHTKDTKIISSENSNSDLQRLNHQEIKKIEVCEIINDKRNLNSKKTIETNYITTEASQASASQRYPSKEQDKVNIQSKFFRRNYRQPQVMRFCPLLSTSDVDISVGGFTVRAKQAPATAKTNLVFNEGVHYWEITCPIRCSSILIGVSQKGKDTHLNYLKKFNQKEPKNLVVQAFRTSTSRVIGIELDLIRLKLRYWIDGKPLNEMAKEVAPGKAWIPTVMFKESGLEVILNPFCVSSDPIFSSGMILRGLKDQSEEQKRSGQRTFPSCLSESVCALQSQFLFSQLDNYLIAFNFPLKEDKNDQSLSENQEDLQVKEILKKIIEYSKSKNSIESMTQFQKDTLLKDDKKIQSEEEKQKSENQLEKDVINILDQEKNQQSSDQIEEQKSEQIYLNLPQFEVIKILRPSPSKSQEDEVKIEKGLQKQSQENSKINPEYTNAALLKFQNEQEALKFLVAAKQSKSAIGLLSSADISLLLDPRYQREQSNGQSSQTPDNGQSINYKPYKHLQLIDGFDILVPQLFRILKNSKLFHQLEKDLIFKYSTIREIFNEIQKNNQTGKQQIELDPQEKELLSQETNLSNLMIQMKDQIQNKSQVINEIQTSQNEKENKYQEEQNIQSVYLPNSDKVLFSLGNKLKLVSRSKETKNNGQFLTDSLSKLYDNQIYNVQDRILFSIDLQDIIFISSILEINLLDQNNNFYVSIFIKQILEYLQSNSNQKSSQIYLDIPYFDALLAVKSMLRGAVLQYKQIEDQARILEAIDLCQNDLDTQQLHSQKQLKNIIDVNKVLSILVKMEEQLYQIVSQSENISFKARKILYSRDLSRIHTAYGRLCTLMQLPSYNQNCPITLSELGVCSFSDSNTSEGLRYYQQSQVDLESLSENQIDLLNTNQPIEVRAALQSQFKGDIFLDGFDTWNVPLSHSLNSMPAKIHQSGIIPSCELVFQKDSLFLQESPNISGLQELLYTDYVLSSCQQNASINLWTTKAGLTRISQLNFKIQAFIDPKDNLNRAQPLFFSYPLKEYENRIKIYSKNKNLTNNKKVELKEVDQEKGEGELMQAMFDDSEAMNGYVVDDNQIIANLEDFQAEIEQREIIEDLQDIQLDDYIEFIDDVYAANDLGDDSGDNELLTDYNQQKKVVAVLKDGIKHTQLNKKNVEKQQVNKDKKQAEKTSIIEPPIEPSAEFLQTLIEMGFSSEVSKLALIKVKNESMAAAVEAAVLFQTEEQQMKGTKLQQKKIAKVEWCCAMCTLINQPGKSQCDICSTEVPEEACTSQEEEKAKKEAEEFKKKQDLLKIEKEIMLREEQKLKIELKKQLELELKEKIKKVFKETKQYFEQAIAKQFFFGSINKGKSVCPIFVGCLFTSEEQKFQDIHFKGFIYRKQYLANFIYSQIVNTKNIFENKLTKEIFETEEECIQSLFENHQQLLESFYPALGQHEDISLKANQFLKSTDIGTVRLPLVKVDWCCQIGENLQTDSNVAFIVKGCKEDGSQSIFYVYLKQDQFANNYQILNFNLPEIEAFELPQNYFNDVKVEDIKSVFRINLQNNQNHLIIHNGSNIDLWQIQEQQSKEINLENETLNFKSKLLKRIASDIDQQTAILKVENINILLKDEQSNQISLIQVKDYDNEIQNISQQIIKEDEKSEKEQISGQENDYLKNQKVDPQKITISEIQKFENLMKGKALSSISNSNNMIIGLPMENHIEGRPQLRRNFWIANNHQQDNFGPLEIKFESVGNLISLNLDLTFSQNYGEDSIQDAFFEKQNDQLEETQIDSFVSQQENFSMNQKDEAVSNLGQFCIKNSFNQQNNSQESILSSTIQSIQLNQPKKSTNISQQDGAASINYLPLLVQKHKGAQFNDKYQVGNLVIDNAEAFASNYPRPEFFFRHVHGHQMRIDKITVRSWHSARSGANPVGSGLVFVADSMEAFERTGPFLKFTIDDYQKWKAKRMLDQRPLRPYEPIAFFELDEGPSITVDVDIKKTCRFIMLKPTGLRKKPHPYKIKHVDGHPMELEFFGVQGSSQPYDLLSDQFDYNYQNQENKEQNNSQYLKTGYRIIIKELQSQQELLKLYNIQIQQLLSGNTPTDLNKTINFKSLCPLGQALEKITDERISQRPLKGLQLLIEKINPSSKWTIRGVSVVGVVTTQAGLLPPLFRSYLMNPQHFEIVNKILTEMLLSNQWNKQLTAYIMQFLVKLARHDSRFVNLIIDTLDLHKFISINILTENQSHIQNSLDFIRCLTAEPRFVRALYEVLIQILIKELPTFIPPRRGYEAIMGMLNWIMPLDLNRSLVVSLDTFYQKICKEQIEKIQTIESIAFRTRCSILLSNVHSPALNFLNHYPFDEVLIKEQNQVQRYEQFDPLSSYLLRENQGSQNSIQLLESKNNLIRDVIIIFDKNFSSSHSATYKFKSYFSQKANVQQINIHFKEQKLGYHKLEVLIINDGKIISQTALRESQLARYARPIAQIQKDEAKQSQSNQDEALKINVCCPPTLEIIVKLIFCYTATSLPIKGSQISIPPPDAIIEFYGSLIKDIDDQQSQNMYQSQIEELQKQQATLIKIGNSVHMMTVPITISPKGSIAQVQAQKMIPFFIQKKLEIDLSQKLTSQIDQNQTNMQIEEQRLIQLIHSPIKQIQGLENNIKNDTQILKQNVIEQTELVQLRKLQEQLKEIILKGKVLQKPLEKSQWTEMIEAKAISASLLVRIREIQEKISEQNQNLESQAGRFKASSSQQYLTTLAVDLSKLISVALKQTQFDKQSLNILLQNVEPKSDQPIVDVSFKLFKHFIAYEQGSARIYVLSLIKDSLWPQMDSQERVQLFSKIALEFLSKPQTMFSQKSVVESLDSLKIPAGDLVHFLCNSLDLQSTYNTQQEQSKSKVASKQDNYQACEKPFVLISSILYLSLQQINRQEKQNAKKDEIQQKKDVVNKILKMVQIKALELARQCKKVHDTLILQKNAGTTTIVGDQNEDGKDQIESQIKQEQKINEAENSQNSDDDSIENLEPLGLKRSFSVPIKTIQRNISNGLTIQARLLSSSAPEKPEDGQNYQIGNLDEDEQFLAVFRLAVWICRLPQTQLSIRDKKALLLQVIENLNGLQKQIKSVSTFAQIVQIGSNDFLELCVAILCIQDSKLLRGLETFLQSISQPHLIQQIQACVISSIEKQNLKGSDAGVGTKRELSEMNDLLKEEKIKSHQLLKQWTHQIQSLLIWIIDRQRQQKSQENIISDQYLLRNSSQSQWANQLASKYSSNVQIWMEHLTYLLKNYITYSTQLQEYENKLQVDQNKEKVRAIDQGFEDSKNNKKIQQGISDKDSEGELVPLKLVKSLSLPIQESKNQKIQGFIRMLSPDETSIQLIRSLMALLIEQKQQELIPAQKISQDKQNQQKFRESVDQIQEQQMGLQQQHIPQIWNLILKLFSTVSVQKLVDAKMLDHLIKEFLRAPDEIQNSMFTEILKLSEQIINNKVHGKRNGMLIANLIFQTLKASINNQKIENICYCLCEGWIDIMTVGSVNGPAQQPLEIPIDKIHTKMNAVELSSFLRKTSNYLIQHLNFGSFEGVAGSQKQIVMRLSIVYGLINIAFNTKLKDNDSMNAIKKLEQLVSVNQQLQNEYQASIDQLIAWLFLNARGPLEEQSQNQIGNVSLITPSTQKVKKITEIIEVYLMKIGVEQSEHGAAKLALRSLVKVVQQFNFTLMEKSNQGCIPIDYLLILSKRSNEYFTKFVGNWLKSDQIASHFVFQLRGFELLLDTIGKNQDDQIKQNQKNLMVSILDDNSSNEQLNIQNQYDESDICDIIIQSDENDQIQSSQLFQQSQQLQKSQVNLTDISQDLQNKANSKSIQIDASNIVNGDEYPNLGNVQELASKNLLLIDEAGNTVQQYSKMDWACNKKCYKNRLIFQALTGALRFEYCLLFQLSQTSLIKEIQIGFTNFWTVDQEIQVTPISIVLQAGMEKDNLTTVCTLEIIQDDGFGSVQTTVFGKNLHTFQTRIKNSKDTLSSIEEIIKNKLGSLNNLQANYIKISMRRHVVCCIENSPIAARQFKKPVFAINYISLLGYKLPESTQVLDNKAKNYIIAEQKKTALEVLSKICSGNFSSVLRVISNQQRTIDKIKSQFDLLASLASVKSSLIEPTFITIAKYNKDMGDWMIKKFLSSKNFEKYASLTANLVMCERLEIPNRLQMLQDYLMNALEESKPTSYAQVKILIPSFQVFIQTVRICAPILTSVKRIDLAVQQQIILQIVDLSSIIEPDESIDIKILRQLAVLLLCPPSPFINTKSDAIKFSQILLDSNEQDSKKIIHRQILVAILASTQSEIAQTIYQQRLLLKQLIEPEENKIEREAFQYSQLEHALSFWSSVSQERNVKKQLQLEKLPFKLYQLLRVKNNANQQNGILSSLPGFLVSGIVELIKNLVAGNEQLEGELANLLVEDLEKLSQSKEMDFINMVFIPLIKVEKTLPITLGVYRGEPLEQVEIVQKIQNDNPKQDQYQNFLSSELLNDSQKNYIKSAFNEIVEPKTSQIYVEKLFNSNWKKVHEWQTSDGDSPENMANYGLWKQLEGKGPCIVFASGKSPLGKKTIFGAFWQGKVPLISEKQQLVEESLYDNLFSTIKVQHKEGDFCFCYCGSQNNCHFISEESPIAQIFLENEEEGAAGLTIGSAHFMLITYSGLEKCFGETVGLKYFNVSGVPKVEGLNEQFLVPTDLNVEFTEIWALDSNENIDNKMLKSSEIDFEETRLAQISTSENRHPWVQERSPFGVFRSQPVYMVPAHLTIQNVCRILLRREGDAGIKTLFSYSNNLAEISQMTVQELYDKFCEDYQVAEENKFILDLKYDRLKVVQSKEIESLKKFDLNKNNESVEALSEQIAAMYVPQMSFFKHFQEKGGVSKIISVTLQTLKLWNSAQLAENWSLWLNELYSFSQIPLFFQLFLKNQKCKDLLFMVLAGLPDQELKTDSTKKEVWDKLLENAIQINYTIIGEVFSVSSSVELREKAIISGLLPRVLERLSKISGEKPRILDDQIVSKENEQIIEPVEQQGVTAEEPKNTEKKKRKGVGYSSKQGQTFDVNAYLENAKVRNDQIKTLVDICSNFLCSKEWQASEQVAQLILESALLPLLEQAFRNGSWLDMAKAAEVYSSYLALTRQLSTHNQLLICLLKIDEKYKPQQRDDVYKLLGKLNELAKIFLGCLSQQKQQKLEDRSESAERPEKLAKDVIETYKIVKEALEEHLKNQEGGKFIENALTLPIAQQYRALLEELRFDYMNMKDPNVNAVNKNGQQDYIHHYKALAAQNESPPASKMIRLAQELADLSNALPCEHTNSIFVRVDKQRVDLMKALIVGSCGTPYAHGCFEFDLFCDNKYPNESPKMNLITTGNGSVRFNPNLYACGKVCLSLLGTWRGSATENWDPKLSTILQVLVSVQAIIMAEEVYFNEPGFENEAGTVEGEKKNEGYANIVRFANVKFAMLGQLKNPSRGFESVIKRHFYVKKFEILKEVHHWIELAQKNEATYTGLVHDHNDHWCSQFKQSKTKYREMLIDVVNQLEDSLNKLEKPTDASKILSQTGKESNKTSLKQKKLKQITEGQAALEDIDVADDNQIDSSQINDKVLNIDDEAVKDRWSRYIGAMGVEAVAKQAAASIFLSGAGSLGIEIAKNIVLSGCKKFTLHDNKLVNLKDLSGQFFINHETDFDINKPLSRAQASLPRLQQLNFYVRCNLAVNQNIPTYNFDEILSNEPWNLHTYDVLIITESNHLTLNAVNQFCIKRNIKFIAADCIGVFSRVFNDFGDNFEVLDKNGEDLLDVVITSISNAEEGVVELLHNQKHKLEDGDEVLIQEVKGMKVLQDQKHDDPLIKSDSINDTVHKVKIISPYSFKIGNTLKFEKYESGGLAKQLRTKLKLKFKRFSESINTLKDSEVPLDSNLAIADFEKMHHSHISHLCYLTLDQFKKENEMNQPKVWDINDAQKFIKIAKELSNQQQVFQEELSKEDSDTIRFLYLFSFQCQGVFNPLCAFIGGLVAQDCIKAITQKFTPTFQLFYYDSYEVLPEFDINLHLQKIDSSNDQQIDQITEKNQSTESIKFIQDYIEKIALTKEIGDRYDGLRIVIGQSIIEKLANTNLFMVGAGAIGCELLKNFAMLGIGRAKKDQNKKGGSIVLTDPDIIEVSNLNRQFLFREKHLRNPKSSTAAAAAIQMNRDLKGNIVARLDKVHEGTQHIFTDQFFEGLTIVTNALDNLAARKYVDLRCVSAKTPLLESGTLGPKGHVQVILPHLTESYNSQKDPEDNTEIPHCTLKMFPEETLHCIEWARDLFGKLFSQGPKSAVKILDEASQQGALNSISSLTSQQDIQAFKEGLNLLKQRPQTFEDCIFYSRLQFEKYFSHDIQQLLHVYPLDAKTKEGTLFWSLPKRPPTPLLFDKDNILHQQLINSMTCLRAKIYCIEIPSNTPRTEDFRKKVAHTAALFKVPDFQPDDSATKEIMADLNKAANQNKDSEEIKEENKKEDQQINEQEQIQQDEDIESLKKDFIQIFNEIGKLEGKETSYENKIMKSEEFEKDNDSNFHIDFMHAMGNCRSVNYKLEPMDWIQVKLKAGRIVPAMATTTASIAGLQTLELVKLLRNVKKADHRNAFLNLAVPIMQASEPGDVQKTKFTDKIETTLWDRWELSDKKLTLQQIMEKFEQKYEGLEIKDILKGNTPIYFRALMNGQGREKEREQLLKKTVAEILEINIDEYEKDMHDQYVDLTITCIMKGDKDEKMLDGIPLLRVNLF